MDMLEAERRNFTDEKLALKEEKTRVQEWTKRLEELEKTLASASGRSTRRGPPSPASRSRRPAPCWAATRNNRPPPHARVRASATAPATAIAPPPSDRRDGRSPSIR